jgi:uncharacterized protein (DUF2336 family)
MSDPRLTRSERRDDDARLLHAAACERIAAAASDLRLPERLRLTDQQRSTMRSLLSKLSRSVEDELRASLLDHETVRGSEGLAAAFASAHVEIAGPIIERSGAAADQGMVGTLIRRTEEHLRFHARGLADMPLLIELIRDADAAVADHAMAILIATLVAGFLQRARGGPYRPSC